MKTRKDKQNGRFLRNTRAAASLASELELNEVHGARMRRALKRANGAASVARFKADRINYKLTTSLVSELMQISASKLSKREVEIIKTFDEVLHMGIKQARASRHCPTKEDVGVLFKILKKASPLRANALSQTFRFRKISQ